MKQILEFFKNHYGKIFAGTTGTVVFTVVGFLFTDSRYMHVKEYAVQIQTLELRIANLEQTLKAK